MKKVIALCALAFIGVGIKNVTATNKGEVSSSQMYNIPVEGDPFVVVGEPSAFTIPNLSSKYYVVWSISSSDFIIHSSGPHTVVVEATKKGESAILIAKVKSMIDGSVVDYQRVLISS